MKTLLIETERRSYTVQDRITAGDVELIDAVRLEEIEKIVWEVLHKKRTPDIIVLDTLTTLKQQTMMDISGTKSGPQSGKLGLWENREKLKSTQPEWGIMSDILTRLVFYLRDLPQTVILVCHEGTRDADDGLRERRAPNLNAALIGPVLDNSDWIIRLGILPKATKVGEKDYPAGTRIARLLDDGIHVAKASTPSLSIVPPAVVMNPTLASILAAVGGKKLPGLITIYGSQGAGKTNLACTGYTLTNEGTSN